jgi:hypothetical protein
LRLTAGNAGRVVGGSRGTAYLGVGPTTAANFSKNWSASFLAAASLVSMELDVSRSFPGANARVKQADDPRSSLKHRIRNEYPDV